MFKFLVLLGALYLLYTQLNGESLNFKTVLESSKLTDSKGILGIVALLILSFINYILEAFKWNIILDKKLGILESCKAVYTGNAVGIFTPGRLGGFIGRSMSVKELSLKKSAITTLTGSYIQMTVTYLFGVIAIILHGLTASAVNVPYLKMFSIVTILVYSLLLVLLLRYRHIIRIVNTKNVNWLNKIKPEFDQLSKLKNSQIWSAVVLSIARYMVFVFQFLILFSLFSDVALSFMKTLEICGFLYVLTALFPSPLLGNLGTREAFLLVMLAAVLKEENIIVISLCLWTINVALPAIIGGILLITNHQKK